MSHDDNDERHRALNESVERALATPEDAFLAWRKGGFETFKAARFYRVAEELPSEIPALAQMPYQGVKILLDNIVDHSLNWGARICAGLIGETELSEQAKEAPVGFSVLWNAHKELSDESTELNKCWRAANKQLGNLDDVLFVAAEEITEGIVREQPQLQPSVRPIGEWVFDHLLLGARLEFLIRKIITDNREGEDMLHKIVGAVTGSEDLEDEANLAAFEAMVGLPDYVLHWPLDERCACGQSLQPAIYCCNPETPFDMSEYVGSFGPEFSLRRPCCGQEFHGFRCDACGRVYSWMKGVVESVSVKSMQ